MLTVEEAAALYGVVVNDNPLALNIAATAEARAQVPSMEDWIDRGKPVASPGPGEYPELETPPVPWLAIGAGNRSAQIAIDR
ncbi:MAG: hypothetical protein R2849_13430 [Thermomicrobiales bacterium]